MAGRAVTALAEWFRDFGKEDADCRPAGETDGQLSGQAGLLDTPTTEEPRLAGVLVPQALNPLPVIAIYRETLPTTLWF